MDDMDLPDDLKDDVEVVYLDDDGMDDFDADEEHADDDVQTEVVDVAKLTFKGHKKAVFVCDLSSDGKIAVTGGEDDLAYVWYTENGEVIMECTGHKDSVTEVGFNHDCTMIATGDLGGLLQAWSIKDKKLVWCYEGDDLGWMIWHNVANVLIAGFKAGDVYVFQLPQGNCKVLPSHGASSNCGKLLPDGKRIAVGYGDGQIKLWDIKATNVIWQINSSNASDITSFSLNTDGTLLCVSPNGHVIKTVDGKLINTLVTEENSEIETSDFDADLGIVATGSLSGDICVWEIGKHVLRHQAKIDCSVTKLQFGKNGKLVVGATDGAIYLCDARSGTLIDTLTGHLESVLWIKLSYDGKWLLSTSDDGTAKIFTIKSE